MPWFVGHPLHLGAGTPKPALRFNFYLGSITDSRSGIVPTFTRATTKLQVDFEGCPHTALSGEVVFDGLRRVHNRSGASETLSGGGWTRVSSNCVGGIDAPDGTLTAFTLTATAPAGSIFHNGVSSLVIGDSTVNAWYIRRRTGVGAVNVQDTDGVSTDVSASLSTVVYKRFSVLKVISSTTPNIGISLGTNGDAVDLWHPTQELVTGQTNQNPSEYVPNDTTIYVSPFTGAMVTGVRYFPWQNGNTVAANVVTEATGASIPVGGIAPLFLPCGYYPEPAGTNICLQSENFGTTWAAVGTPTRVATSDRCGNILLDLIGDDDAGVLEGYTQTITYTGNGIKSLAVSVKKGTATSSVVRLRDTTGAADRLLFAITWTGSVPTVTMTTGTLIQARQYIGNVYRIEVLTAAVTAANTNSLQCYPATDAALSAAATGTILMGGVQTEDNIDRCHSYIPTTTATVTCNKDDLQITSLGAWYNPLQGTLVSRLSTYRVTGAVQYAAAFTDNTVNELIAIGPLSNATLFVVDGGVNQALIQSGVINSFTSHKLAGAWAANDFALAFDGALVGTDATGTLPTATAMGLGQRESGGSQMGGVVSSIEYYNTRLANDRLVKLAT